jgi:hypothetical protein
MLSHLRSQGLRKTLPFWVTMDTHANKTTKKHSQCDTMHATKEAMTAQSPESSTPASHIQKLQFSTEDVTQTIRNFYLQQLHQNIIPTPIYTVTELPTATSSAPTEDNMNTVEKIDAQLARMEQNWAKTRSGPFPEGIQNVIADL